MIVRPLQRAARASMLSRKLVRMEKYQDKSDATARWHEVLIVTGGSTPQVVTETVFGLSRRSPDPIVPDKVICIVTNGVSSRFKQELPGQLTNLAAAWKIPLRWKKVNVEIVQSADGTLIDDVRSHEDAIRYGDLVAKIVRQETARADSRVHLSIAGGRKTMSFHGGAAMTLFGRLQDELSHVLVHPESFIGCADFWFPTPESSLVRHRDGSELDAHEAKVELSLNPFLRMRENLPLWLRGQDLDYASYVAHAQAAAGHSQLQLITSRRLVRIKGLPEFELPNRQFALYQLMAEWCQNQRAGAGFEGVGDNHRGWLTPDMLYEPDAYSINAVQRFLAIYDQTFRTSADVQERSKRIVNSVTQSRANDSKQRNKETKERINENKSYFDPVKSLLLEALHKHLKVPELSLRYGAPVKPLKPARFGLLLVPKEIEILDE
jgi:CRISPR-associated protein (TIGR02584 family)